MFVLILELDVHIPASNSLKHKRMIVNSFKGRLRSRFNVSVSETGGLDKWQRATIAVSHTAAELAGARKTAEKVLGFTEAFSGLELLAHKMEIL